MATPTRPDIRAAFFDIDGTLLPFGAQQIPADTRAALAALRRQGVGVYIATGRPPVHLPALKPLQGVEFDGFVTMNGQYCYDRTPAEPFYRRPLPPDAMQTLIPWLAGTPLAVAFVETDFVYVNDPAALDTGFCGPELPVLDPARALTRETYQLSAFIPPEWEAEFLAHCPGCKAVRWNRDFADILPADGGKPAGLARTLARRGLQAGQAIAFGDGDNDITMLQYAGIGVAMGNADAKVRAAADYVTAADTEGGIAAALRNFHILP